MRDLHLHPPQCQRSEIECGDTAELKRARNRSQNRHGDRSSRRVSISEPPRARPASEAALRRSPRLLRSGAPTQPLLRLRQTVDEMIDSSRVGGGHLPLKALRRRPRQGLPTAPRRRSGARLVGKIGSMRAFRSGLLERRPRRARRFFSRYHLPRSRRPLQRIRWTRGTRAGTELVSRRLPRRRCPDIGHSDLERRRHRFHRWRTRISAGKKRPLNMKALSHPETSSSSTI